MAKHLIIGMLAAMVGVLGTLAIVLGQSSSTATVEVRVWQAISDSNSLYVSARPAGGSWRELGTIPLDMSGVSRSGAYRFGDIALRVPLPEQPSAPDVTPVVTPTQVASSVPTATAVDTACEQARALQEEKYQDFRSAYLGNGYCTARDAGTLPPDQHRVAHDLCESQVKPSHQAFTSAEIDADIICRTRAPAIVPTATPTPTPTHSPAQ